MRRSLIPILFLVAVPVFAAHREVQNVEVVQVPVYVSTARGVVTGLTKDNFELFVNGKPQAIPDAQAHRMLDTKEEAAAQPKHKIKVDYEIGDAVKVLDGPFASFNGVVEELDFDRARVKVSVSIFGRATPVELEFEQVERVK